MKNLFSVLFFALFTFYLSAQDLAKPTVPQDKPDTVSINGVPVIPDSICTTVMDERICLPTKDGKEAGAIIEDLIAKNKGNWPKTPLGWVMWIIAFVLTPAGVAFAGNVKAIYNFLRVFLRKTLHVVAFIAGLAAAGITFALGRGEFDWQMFATLWGIFSFVAVYVYESWIKKTPEPKKTV